MKSTIAFLKDFSWPFGLTTGALFVALLFVPDGALISARAFGVTVAILFALVITLGVYAAREVARPRGDGIRIEQILEGGRLFLITKGDDLGMNMAANIYHREGKHERFIGQGVVETRQENGLVQLRMEYVEALEASLSGRIAQNEDGVRENLIVRAGVIIRPRGDLT